MFTPRCDLRAKFYFPLFIISLEHIQSYWVCCFPSIVVFYIYKWSSIQILVYWLPADNKEHDMSQNMRKLTFWHMHPKKTQINLHIHTGWSVVTVCMMKICILAYPKCAQWRFWSNWATVQAGLNLHWMHISEGTFSDSAVFIFLAWKIHPYQQ